MEQEPLFDLGPDWAGFDKDVTSALGKAGAGDVTLRGTFDVAGAVPERVVSPRSIPQVSAVVRAVAQRGLSVVPLGLGTHAASAGPPDRPFVALSLSGLNRVIDFKPSNMTFTVESGATLESVQAAAARAGQWLPLDPPLADKTTIGGLIAGNLSGPVRFSQGTVRDLLIGLKVVGADGALIHGGAQVVKNVAGYDLPKLYCGSEGTLGIIVEATFKVRPLPSEIQVLQLRCDTVERTQDLLGCLVVSGLEPSFVELLSFVPRRDVGYNLVVGCLGAGEQLSYQMEHLRAILAAAGPVQVRVGEAAQAAMRELRDFRVAGTNPLRIKASLLPSNVMSFVAMLEKEGEANGIRIALQAHAGNGIVYARLREATGSSDVTEMLAALVVRLRAAVEELDGSLLVTDGPPELRQRLPAGWPSGGLMKKLKEKLDPKNILSPGRFLS